MDMLEIYKRGWGIDKLGHVYTNTIRPWLSRIFELSLVESVIGPCFKLI